MATTNDQGPQIRGSSDRNHYEIGLIPLTGGTDSTLPLSPELQPFLGLVTYIPEDTPLLPSPKQEGQPPTPEPAWHTDESTKGTPQSREL